jgi:hypothetical protein
MKKGAKAQAAMEYMMIAGLVALIIIPTTLLFYNYASESANEIDSSQIDKFGRDVMNTAESVYYLGSPSRIIIEERLPKNVESISIEQDSGTGNYLFAIAANSKNGIVNLSFPSNVRIEGIFDVEDRGPGIKNVRISAERDATNKPFVYIRFSDFSRVFVSSVTYTGDLVTAAKGISAGFSGDGLQAADFICQNLANAASLGGTWKAWLSTSTANAQSRIVDKAYKHVNNTLVANNMADLIDGTISNAIRMTETRSLLLPGEAVWTGTTSAGVADVNTCNGWASAAVNGRTGLASSSGTAWTDNAASLCSSLYHIYCFEQ